MRVIGVGFGRTGTFSLKVALEVLGFGPCYHMSVVATRPDDARRWEAVADGAGPDWDALFSGFQATVDWPAAAYWRELVAYYPDAKVILTVRDPYAWYDSAAGTIIRGPATTGPLRRLPRPVARRLRRLWMRLSTSRMPARYLEANTKIIGGRVFDNRFADRDHAFAVFQRHITEVTQHVDPDRLLAYDIRDGWAPLCRFLGVPVPDSPFPRLNDRTTRRRRRRRLVARRLGPPVSAAVIYICVAYAAERALARRRQRLESRA